MAGFLIAMIDPHILTRNALMLVVNGNERTFAHAEDIKVFVGVCSHTPNLFSKVTFYRFLAAFVHLY